MGPKITFVGGGSYQWGPKLLADLADTPSLQAAEIVLHDINPEPMPLIMRFVEHLKIGRSLSWTVSTTTDRREALRDADYVIVCISTGALESMTFDINIPLRYGVRQSVGDSVGPGGIIRVLRNIPVLVSIARDMEAFCPQAWLLNLTNPMTTLTRSVQASSDIEAIGLCHEVTLVQYHLSLLLDCDMRSIDLKVCGVNHFPLITEFTINGEDGLATLADKIDDIEQFGNEVMHLPAMMGGHEASTAGGTFTKAALLGEHRVKFELLRRFGVLPAAGDRHLVEFFPNFLTEASGWGERWGVHLTTIDDRATWQAHYIGELEATLAKPSVPRQPSGEMVAALIDSRLRNKPRSFPLNLANGGQCPDLPYDVVVESMGTVDGDGVRAREEAFAPPLLAEYLRRVSASQELTVDAALSGERQLVFEAMLADPLASTVDYDALWAMTNEMIDATLPWLPQFA